MSRLLIGVDPGISGAVAAVSLDRAEVLAMPVETRSVGKKIRRQVNAEQLASLIGMLTHNDPAGCVMAVVERSQASPHMGVSSAFSYGSSFGVVVGVLGALKIPVMFTSASVWKRHMGLIVPGSRELGRNSARDKSPALELARKLYPQLAHLMKLKIDDGKAEALLLAHYGHEVIEETEAK